MAGWNREVNVASIDGVPLVWADAPGPMRASLMFRVGHADERLPWSGITHLVEHLALFALGPHQTYEFNGAVTANRTMFVATGSPADITAFLAHVTTTLGNLPLDRMETEKSVLLTEATSRSMTAGDVMFNLRFGARGSGLYRYKEFGLLHLPGPWVTAWSARYFNRSNAVLWLSGRPPADLHISLPDGPRIPEATVTPLTLGLPAYAQAPVGGAGLSLFAPRSTPLAMASAIAAARLLKRLRYDKGIAYSVQGGYFPMDKEQAHVSLWTDAQAGHAEAVLNDTVHTMYGMGTEGPAAEELADEVGALSRNLDRDDAALAWLDRSAVRVLNGEPPQRPSDLLEDMQTVTPATARDAIAAALRTAIYLGPLEVPAPPGIHAYGRPAVQSVRGDVLQHVQGALWKSPPTLVVGGDGVTLNVNAQERVTVMYGGCEALLRYADGGICLVGFETSFLPINPTEWVQAPEMIERIVRAVPAELVVPNAGEATPVMINVPAQAAPQRLAVGGIPLDRWIALMVFVTVGVALLMFAVFGNSTGVGSGPPLISLIVWGLLAYRVYRWLRI